MIERLFARILVAAALCMALLAFSVVPIPAGGNGKPDLPALAFGQTWLYRMEVALLIFYGDLLLATPAFTGIFRGRLPIEISTRGAKFAEGANRSVKLDEAAVRKLEATTEELSQGLAAANLKIDLLHEMATSDNRQPEVDSKE